MNPHVKIARNTGVLMGMELGIRILETLVSIIMARYLAPQGYGLLFFALAFVSFFEILPGFGLGTLVTRNMAQETKDLDRYLSNGLLAKALLSLVTLVAIVLTCRIVGFSFGKTLLVFFAGVLVCLEALLRFTTAFFRSQQKMATVATFNLSLHGGWILAALLTIAMRGGVTMILILRVLVSVPVVAASVWLIHRRLQRIVWSFDWGFMWRLLKSSFPFALFQLFVVIYVKIDVVMLSFMKGDVVTGWYAAAQKFHRLLTFIPSSVVGSTLPAMSKLSKESLPDLVHALEQNSRFLGIIALPLAGMIYILAERLILLFCGRPFLPATHALQVLIWTVFFSFLNNGFTSVLAAVNLEKKVGWALALGAILNILTNLVAIPIWGHVGAAATTLLAEAAVLSVQVTLIRRALPQARPLAWLAKPIAATAAMMAFAWFVRDLNLAFIVLGSAAVYLVVLVASRAVGAEEWIFMKALFSRKGVASAHEPA